VIATVDDLEQIAADDNATSARCTAGAANCSAKLRYR